MSDKQLYFGGLPTEPDIKKLREVFPESEMKPGKAIAYEEVSAIIKVPYGSSRFQAVTNQWRKVVEKETNIIIGTKPGEAFVVLSESEKVGLSGDQLRKAGRRARRAWVVSQRIERTALTEEERRRLDHHQGVASNVIASAQLRNGKRQLPAV